MTEKLTVEMLDILQSQTQPDFFIGHQQWIGMDDLIAAARKGLLAEKHGREWPDFVVDFVVPVDSDKEVMPPVSESSKGRSDRPYVAQPSEDSAKPLAADPRNCTCHPDDNPPDPCAHKYAYSECVKATDADEIVAAVDVKARLRAWGLGQSALMPMTWDNQRECLLDAADLIERQAAELDCLHQSRAKPLAADIEVSIAMLGQVVEDVKRGLANDESVMVIQEAATIIERQAAEIEKWKKELVAAQAEIGTLKEEKAVAWLRYGDAQAEIERLNTFKSEYYDTMLEENLGLRRRLEMCSAQIGHLKAVRDAQVAVLASRSSEAQKEPHSEESNPEGEA